MTIKKNIKTERIEEYKRELIHYYIILMNVILFLFALKFTFITPYRTMSWYLYGGMFFITYTYLIIRKSYSVDILVHGYMILASLYNFYVMLAFWNYSVASFMWLIPIPLAAYVFFTRKYVLIYSLYVLFNILMGYLINRSFAFDFPKQSPEDIRISDTFLVISNVAVIALLLYFKDKIKRVEIYNEIEAKLQTEEKTASTLVEHDTFSEELFEKIENLMKEKHLYKDVSFNISKLAVEMNINSSYISKAIRYKGYPNFNNYLNLYRINCVKKLLDENDLERITLMYIYTEAGFSNQSTFNRVFKQIEGTTPSEYISRMSL
ncbi:AraC family transcriptional regulator [Chryseobacterium carnipullorum]|uniref:Adenosine deaminase n=1 Tax=Chryseobacterium carnipullorum TaxID=1124835 RepID=A0A376E3K8_CHRCU|nr:AraC family transcriptional regulator [Chryseobacterium carnipullorum]AZA50516.1 AraC family transcriptional regulator [Chryseobacterium carnipullorum]AZA65381.1 AraC family transcriptional regulator [Chryseobacterium carnipullorum]STD00089.1 Adenosine deaminase [Chryseobacterium carnipullorum]